MPRTNLRDQFPNPKAVNARIVKRNTFEYENEGAKVVRLHRTDIVFKHANGSVTLYTGGWKTVTTKDRINDHLPAGFSLYQEKGQWWIVDRGTAWDNAPRIAFYEGITVPDCFRDTGAIAKGASDAAAEKELRRRIAKFVKAMPVPMPVPNSGDCWLCSMRDSEGKEMGSNDTSHILSHIEEGYHHGSLIWNALKWAGRPRPELYWQMKLEDRAKAMLRRYLYARLGLVR